MKMTPLVGKIHSPPDILMAMDFPFFSVTEGCGCFPAKKLSSRTFFDARVCVIKFYLQSSDRINQIHRKDFVVFGLFGRNVNFEFYFFVDFLLSFS